MEDRVYEVRAMWDAEASVWVATSDDIPGLATWAATFEGLEQKLSVMIPELLQLESQSSSRSSEHPSYEVQATKRTELLCA